MEEEAERVTIFAALAIMAALAAAAKAEPPNRRERFSKWVRDRSAANVRGAARGIVALALLGTIAAINVRAPRGMSDEVLASLRTLVIAVAAFYFGSRLRRDRSSGERQRDRVSETARVETSQSSTASV
jgi:hypothetical protein